MESVGEESVGKPEIQTAKGLVKGGGGVGSKFQKKSFSSIEVPVYSGVGGWSRLQFAWHTFIVLPICCPTGWKSVSPSQGEGQRLFNTFDGGGEWEEYSQLSLFYWGRGFK